MSALPQIELPAAVRERLALATAEYGEFPVIGSDVIGLTDYRRTAMLRNQSNR
jgi:hypothetical protein